MPVSSHPARRATERDGADAMRLLVSVRDADEARIAAECGADIVDAKDPDRGALGAVGDRVLEQIVAAVGDRCPVSAAIGDIGDPALVAADRAVAAGAIFVKVGCERVDASTSIAEWLQRALGVVDSGRHDSRFCTIVLAAYADCPAAHDPNQFIDLAARGGAGGVLLDTLNKAGPSLFRVMEPDIVARWVEVSHAAGLWLALAGGLMALDIGVARALGADIIGVRGAACRGGRTGRLSAERVRNLVCLSRGRASSDRLYDEGVACA